MFEEEHISLESLSMRGEFWVDNLPQDSDGICTEFWQNIRGKPALNFGNLHCWAFCRSFQICRLNVNPGLDFRLTRQTKCSAGQKCDRECQRNGRGEDQTIHGFEMLKLKYFSA